LSVQNSRRTGKGGGEKKKKSRKRCALSVTCSPDVLLRRWQLRSRKNPGQANGGGTFFFILVRRRSPPEKEKKGKKDRPSLLSQKQATGDEARPWVIGGVSGLKRKRKKKPKPKKIGGGVNHVWGKKTLSLGGGRKGKTWDGERSIHFGCLPASRQEGKGRWSHLFGVVQKKGKRRGHREEKKKRRFSTAAQQYAKGGKKGKWGKKKKNQCGTETKREKKKKTIQQQHRVGAPEKKKRGNPLEGERIKHHLLPPISGFGGRKKEGEKGVFQGGKRGKGGIAPLPFGSSFNIQSSPLAVPRPEKRKETKRGCLERGRGTRSAVPPKLRTLRRV